MNTEIILLSINLLLMIATLLVLLLRKSDPVRDVLQKMETKISESNTVIEQIRKNVGDEFSRNRSEVNENAKSAREELARSLELSTNRFSANAAELRETVEKQLKNIREDNHVQLEEMRRTVDEKLQKSINDRLSQSFETVGKQLQAVQEGLGEMKNLASDVGGLKKVLSNVKMRGGFGEIQLSMLLEQILAPEQYQANVKTKVGSSDTVEFAIKLPGRENNGTVYLPIDAKFPRDYYEAVQNAYEEGDLQEIASAQKNLEAAVKKMAKDISDKYIDPPNTTDFGIMFLPFEGMYAEIVRKASLLEDLQKNYKIIVTGPTTLAVILNSLQMGFKTLAIEKRSSEVWKILGEVKTEFETFGGMLEKAKKNIENGLSGIEDVMGKRTRAIQRKLKGVESVPMVAEIAAGTEDD